MARRKKLKLDFSEFEKEAKEMYGYINKLEPKVQENIKKMIYHHMFDYVSDIKRCESPIEQLMVLALIKEIEWRNISKGELYFEVQDKIKILNKTYRADICMYLGDITFLEDCKKLIIECDGHDFHEKTKEQASKDKQRDRTLMMAGYNIIHFTGSEIWADSSKCAHEAMELLLK